MALKKPRKLTDTELFDLLGDFEGLMRLMVQNGVTYQSFKVQTGRMYVAAAVTESKGNYCEAAKRIGLHRNNVTRILGTRKARYYVDTVYQNASGETDSE